MMAQLNLADIFTFFRYLLARTEWSN